MKKHVDNFEAYICAIIFLSMTAVGFANVIVRYMTSYSFAATQELMLVGFLLLTVFGASMAAAKGQHLAVTFFVSLLGKTTERWVNIGASFISALLLILSAWYCLQLVQHQIASGVTSAGLQIPEWYYSAGLPLGFFLIAVRTLQFAFNEFKNPNAEEIPDV